MPGLKNPGIFLSILISFKENIKTNIIKYLICLYFHLAF